VRRVTNGSADPVGPTPRWNARRGLRFIWALFASAFLVGTFVACGGCGKRAVDGPDGKESATGANIASPSASTSTATPPLVPSRLWESADSGDAEDLAALATHEGAIGLVAGARDPSRKKTAIRAMGHARGWAQLPFLAEVASAKDDDEAALALAAVTELAVRPRRSEDVEDADELREGCISLQTMARDTAKPRSRRVGTIRALRMMPCPPADGGLPSDVDSK
jgi:hypothetical protein